MVVPFTCDASFITQFIGVLSIAGFSFLTSLIAILAVNKCVLPIRASDEEQELGLDVTEIGVESYPEFK